MEYFLPVNKCSADFVYNNSNLRLSLSTFHFSTRRSAPMTNRWIRPEVYPLFAATGVAIGICVMQLIRNISTNPEVRVNRVNRAAGILDNHAEGEKYSQHFVRKYVRGKAPEIMPGINSFFTDPERN